MAISLKTAGTWARMVTDNGTVTIPGSPAAGDRMFLFGSWKTYTITVVDPAGWTLISDFSDGAVAAGNGTGSVHNAVWYRDWQSGDADPAIDYSAAPTEGHWVVMLWQKGGADTWGTPVARTGAIASADPFTVDASATVTIPDASVVMGLIGLRDDSATIARATDAIDDTGALVTWNGNYVENPSGHFTSTTGFDMSGDLGHRLVTTGAAGVTLHMDGDPAAAETGSATWLIQGLFVSDPQLVTPTTASLTTATFAPTVTATANQLVTSGVASLTLTTFAPSVATPRLVTPGIGSLTLTGFAPDVSASSGLTLTPGIASVVTATFAPSVAVSDHQLVTPGAASLSLTGLAPSVAVTDHKLVTPGVAAVSTATFAPSVTASDHKTVIPTPASLTLTAFAPNVAAGVSVTPGVAALTLAAFAPDVLVTDNKLVTPAAANLILTTFAASVLVPRTVTPSTATLVLSGFAPTVSVSSGPNVVPGTAILTLTTFAPTVTGSAPGELIVRVGRLSGSIGQPSDITGTIT